MSSILNLNDTTPSATSGYQLSKWQRAGTPAGTDPTTGLPYFDVSTEVPNTGGVLKKTANYTAVAGDCGQLLSFNSGSAVAYTLPATPPVVAVSRWQVAVENIGAGALTISATTAAKLDGITAGTLVLAQNTGCKLYTDGTDYFTERGAAQPGSLLTLKHDGTLNGSQTLLNLKGSTSVAIADDGSGGLTFTAVGPNLPPVVRGWNKASGSGTSATIALTGLSAPGGGTASAVAGDLAILNIGMTPASLTTPSGWTPQTSGTGASWNGYTFSRVLSSGDISAGNISVTLSGSSTAYDVHLVVVQSGTYSSIREAVSAQSTGSVAGGNPVTPTTSSAVVAGDLGIYFGTNEFIFSGLGETLSRGSVVQTSTNGDNIGVSATEAIAAAGAVAVTFTAGTNSVYGHYGSIVIVIGLATAVGNGTVTSVGVTVPSDFAVSVANPTTTPAIAITGGVTKSGVQQEAYTYAADTGAANAYAVTLSPAPTLVAGSEVCFKAVNANTGASTLAVNGGTATAIKKNGNSTALASGDIAAGQIVTAKYDGTVWQILVPGSGGTSPVMVASGASHAAGLAPDPGATAGTTKFLREDATWAVPAGGGGYVYPGPQSSIPGCVRWFDASQIAGLTDGASVNTWLDMATGYLGVAAGTSPIYKTSILNGLAIVRFGGAGSFKITAPTIEQSFSFFLVLKPSSLANSYSGILGQNWSTDQGGYFVKSNGKTALYMPGSLYDGTGSATITTSTFVIVSGVIGPGTWSTRVALASDASGSGSNTTASNQVLIGNQPVSGRFFSGDIAEIVMYQRALTSSEVSTIENGLKTKYGL